MIIEQASQTIPPGYFRVEAYSNGREVVVMGMPHADDESHNCDAMGCSSVGLHVVYRFPIPESAQSAKSADDGAPEGQP